MKQLAAAVLLTMLAGPVLADDSEKDRREWVPLFDGRSLEGWTPKITGYEPASTSATPSASRTAC